MFIPRSSSAFKFMLSKESVTLIVVGLDLSCGEEESVSYPLGFAVRSEVKALRKQASFEWDMRKGHIAADRTLTFGDLLETLVCSHDGGLWKLVTNRGRDLFFAGCGF